MKDEEIQRLAGGWHGQPVHGRKLFDETVLDFLDELSKEIQTHPLTAGREEFAAFAFWCRKRQLKRWETMYQSCGCRVGRGLIFHIAPSNILCLFAYSMVFGLLAGNGNLIRVSTHIAEEAKLLCDVIHRVMQREAYREIYQENVIFTYDHDQEKTEYFTSVCEGRVIWGGDASIEAIRRASIAPGAVQLEFADRYSVAVFQEESLAAMDSEQLTELAHHFYNDTLQVDQNACSSPHFVFWLGNGNQVLQQRWWETFEVVSRKYPLDAWKVSEKYASWCGFLMDEASISSVKTYQNRLYLANLESVPEDIGRFHGKFGTFFQCTIAELEELAGVLNRKVQTVLYAGVRPDVIRDMVIACGCKGVDRVVPVGQALMLTPVWDGEDVIERLSRIIVVAQ